MLVVIVCVTAVLAGAAVLTSMQTKSSRGSEMTRATLTGVYCAEAGLTLTRPTIVASPLLWAGWLGVAAEPPWLGLINHDIDGDGVPDFTINLRDNDDESPNDLAVDNDSAVFIVSTCIKHPESRSQVVELVNTAGDRKLWLRTE